MIWVIIILSCLLFSVIFTLFVCKTFCGNMDKEYYNELEFKNEKETNKKEENTYDKEI